MESREFSRIRKKLGKTQRQMAQLLGTSIKAVHSYEQGWRTVPAHAERQMYYLAFRRRGDEKEIEPCWIAKNCPEERKRQCPAWEFHAGKVCWFINGTICEGSTQKNWEEKMKICRSCEVLSDLLGA
jgi:DNA-binding XRE family transcriptional regulator